MITNNFITTYFLVVFQQNQMVTDMMKTDKITLPTITAISQPGELTITNMTTEKCAQ